MLIQKSGILGTNGPPSPDAQGALIGNGQSWLLFSPLAPFQKRSQYRASIRDCGSVLGCGLFTEQQGVGIITAEACVEHLAAITYAAFC